MTDSIYLNVDYFTAVELQHAVNQRIVDLIVKRKYDVSSSKVQALWEVKDQLEDFINKFVEKYEAQVAERESQILDNDYAVENFLNDEPEDDISSS